MNFSLVAAMIMVLGSPSARTRDLQVEAVNASGAELPALRDAVARALVVGGARVIMRGPTTRACEYCARIKVTEISPGIFRVEATDQESLASTTLDLSAGSRLLDRARAIAIHARLLVGGPAGQERKDREVATLPARKPEVKAAPAKTQGQAAPVPVAQEPSPVRAPEPLPIVAPAPSPLVAPEPTRVQPARAENKAPSRSVEVKRSVAAEAKPIEPKEPAPVRREATKAVKVRTDLVVAPSNLTLKPQWPWIPTALGAGAALGAGVCALVARQRYNGLSDKTQSLDRARSLKSSGESWQTAAFVLSGVAAAGFGVGIVGFATRSAGEPAVTATVSPMPNGGMATLVWGMP